MTAAPREIPNAQNTITRTCSLSHVLQVSPELLLVRADDDDDDVGAEHEVVVAVVDEDDDEDEGFVGGVLT